MPEQMFTLPGLEPMYIGLGVAGPDVTGVLQN